MRRQWQSTKKQSRPSRPVRWSVNVVWIKATALSAATFITGEEFWRGCVAVVCFLLFWQIGSRSVDWLGFAVPAVSQIPPPTAVLHQLRSDPGTEFLVQWIPQQRAGVRRICGRDGDRHSAGVSD